MKQNKGRKRAKRFSVVAAVKDNARREVGQPPPARILTVKTPERVAGKHKPTLGRVLAAAERELGTERESSRM